MRWFDVQRGVLALGHFEEKDSTGTPFDWQNRQINFACRVLRKDDGTGIHDEKHAEPKTFGPIHQGVCVPGDAGRQQAQHSWAWAMQVESFPEDTGTGTSEGMKVRPVHKAAASGWTLSSGENDKLGAIEAHAYLGLKYPKDFPGVVVGASDLSSQQAAFIAGGGVLSAPHFNGPAYLGSYVFDLTPDGKLDRDFKAPLQSLTRVHSVPSTGLYGLVGEEGLALQIGISRHPEKPEDKRLRGAVVADHPSDGQSSGLAVNQNGWQPSQLLGSLSKGLDGPLKVAGCTKHDHGSSRFDKYGAVHLNHNTFFFVNDLMDAPLKHSGLFPECSGGGTPTEVYFVYDDRDFHPSVTGQKKGRHKWYTLVPERFTGTGTFIETGGTGTETGVTTETGGITTETGGTGTETGVTTETGGITTETGGITTETGGIPTDGPVGTETGPIQTDGPIGTEGPPPPPPGGQTLISLDRYLYKRAGLNGRLVQLSSGGRISALPLLLGPTIGNTSTMTNAPTWSRPTVSTVPGFNFKAQHYALGSTDMRNARTWGAAAAAFYESMTPTVMRLQAMAAQNGNGFTHTIQPGASLNSGGSATGAAWWMPGELDLSQVVAGNTPATYSTATVGMFNSQLGFGTPITNGLVGSGWTQALSGGSLVFSTTSATGTPTTAVTMTSTGIGPAQSIRVGTLAARPEPIAIGQIYIANDDCNTGGGLYFVREC